MIKVQHGDFCFTIEGGIKVEEAIKLLLREVAFNALYVSRKNASANIQMQVHYTQKLLDKAEELLRDCLAMKKIQEVK